MKNYNRFVQYSMQPAVSFGNNNRFGFFPARIWRSGKRSILRLIMRMFNRSG